MDIVGADVVLGAQCLETSGEFSMNIKEMYLKWKGGNEILIKGTKTSSPQVVSSHQISLIKKGQSGSSTILCNGSNTRGTRVAT